MRHSFATLLILPALLLGCAGAPAMPDHAFHITTTPYPQLQGPRGTYGGWWQPRFETKCKEAQAGGFQVLFVGDSITHGIDDGRDAGIFKQMLAPATFANFGYSGDRTEHVLWRFDHGELFGKLDPKVVMVMIGTNNTGHRMDPPADIADGVEAIVGRLTDRFPKAHILLLGIFPRGATPLDAGRVNNQKTNELLVKWAGADKPRVHYLDIGSRFLDEKGNLPASLMPDHLHPNAAGYKIWAEAVVPEIKKLLEK